MRFFWVEEAEYFSLVLLFKSLRQTPKALYGIRPSVYWRIISLAPLLARRPNDL